MKNIYSIGINGGPTGLEDCLCLSLSKGSCIHAEVNAIAKCDPDKTRGSLVIVTLSPCITCAALLINSGVESVVYCESWKDTEGIRMLRDAGVYVHYANGLFEEDY